MMIIGCDYHPGFQQIAFVDTETGGVRRTATGAQGGTGKFFINSSLPLCHHSVFLRQEFEKWTRIVLVP
jgi:hypothetical protein